MKRQRTTWRESMMRRGFFAALFPVLLAVPGWCVCARGQGPDLILHGGRIVTVDERFSVAQAMAIQGDQILAVGADIAVKGLAGPNTKMVDLKRRTVLPGLIDSHVHATGASVYEFDHPVPVMENIADVLKYIASRAAAKEKGEWIRVQQVFITRLREQRFPTRAELDRVAPDNPVDYRTGPDASLNSLALKLSGIDKDFKIPAGESGVIERNPSTGEPTGIIRGARRFIKFSSSDRGPSGDDRLVRLRKLIRDYNSIGITSFSDRNASDSAFELYKQLYESKELTCRVYLYYSVNAQAPLDEIKQRLERARQSPFHKYNDRLWLRGVKIFLDGGMLTGSAYMRKPWGVSEIYAITDPAYRGTLYVQPERLFQISKLTMEHGFQMTAHSVGDGAVHALIAAYEEVDKERPIRPLRPCITHCNFMSREAIAKMKEIGIVADLQPAWLYLDGATLRKQFGDERMRYFQPYRSLFEAGVTVGGGSDHMQKIGSLRAVNPYNPFLGMWIAMSRVPRRSTEALHAEERISREQALRLYTINNAHLTFEERRKGSIEAGKYADFVIIDRDYLKCPLDEVKDIRPLQTYVGGKLVYTAPE